ncbi:MAG: bifunctional 4-hydroxy-3-methylbut-2-enyl diphosphate reductase/30S ribosomal protein S1 [Lachnospiraceae bacterium]|nr:bifunctional 4-hydroxy-3-methylbut-2-enyl diphosphate reductase/30S ribosomal protein S1 [Lachnospiraceae bacterium]
MKDRKITVAASAGFCYGVKRAVDIVKKLAGEGRKVFTFGPITHNESVVEELKAMGVGIVNDIAELEGITNATIVIRSHGVGREICKALRDSGNEIVDATCQFVKKIHNIVDERTGKGEFAVIIGDPEHPEVKGICSWCNGPFEVINSPEEAKSFASKNNNNIFIVSQTTYDTHKFEVLVEILSNMRYNVTVVNTICNATEIRQRETLELAKNSDAMIVIGGKHSSNTRKLFEISKEQCENTYYIQTHVDLDLSAFKSFRCVGITAGASTPKTIIKEVLEVMSEENFEQMLNDSLKTIHNGEVVEGTVISVKEDMIALNIDYKADGIITRSEYTNEPGLDLRTVVKEGDKMQVKVLKVNDGEGQVLLSYRKLAAERGSKRLEEAFEKGEILKAKVISVLGGGICVSIDETRVFIPASLVSDVYEKDLEKYKDQEIEFVLSEFNPRKRRIIGDRKQILAARKAEAMKALFEKIHVGDTVEGTVKNITDFGAFIDLGGADGLLHISEMSWGRIENPRRLFKVGDKVKAFIKDIQGEKVALSMKFPDQNPWVDAETRFAPGTVVTGKVVRMPDFGAFVEIYPGVDALLHVSQIAKEHIDKPSDVLKLGQEVTAKIVDFSLADKKISLSIKALLAPEPKAEATSEEAAESDAAEEEKKDETLA